MPAQSSPDPSADRPATSPITQRRRRKLPVIIGRRKCRPSALRYARRGGGDQISSFPQSSPRPSPPGRGGAGRQNKLLRREAAGLIGRSPGSELLANCSLGLLSDSSPPRPPLTPDSHRLPSCGGPGLTPLLPRLSHTFEAARSSSDQLKAGF